MSEYITNGTSNFFAPPYSPVFKRFKLIKYSCLVEEPRHKETEIVAYL